MRDIHKPLCDFRDATSIKKKKPLVRKFFRKYFPHQIKEIFRPRTLRSNKGTKHFNYFSHDGEFSQAVVKGRGCGNWWRLGDETSPEISQSSRDEHSMELKFLFKLN